MLDPALADVIEGIVIPSGVTGINYDYGEIKFAPAATSKALNTATPPRHRLLERCGAAPSSRSTGSVLDPSSTWLTTTGRPVPGVSDRRHQPERADYMVNVEDLGQGAKRPRPRLWHHRLLGVRHGLGDLAGTQRPLRVRRLVHRDHHEDLQRGRHGPSLGLAGNGLSTILDLLYPTNRIAVEQQHLRRTAAVFGGTSRTSSATSLNADDRI